MEGESNEEGVDNGGDKRDADECNCSNKRNENNGSNKSSEGDDGNK
ncbi:12910_t:CDS:2, partial [Funneliformis geosporum]